MNLDEHFISQAEWEGVRFIDPKEIEEGVQRFWNNKKLSVDADGKVYRTNDDRERPINEFMKKDFVKPVKIKVVKNEESD